MERESMSFDVLIVGAGPAGLAASIRLAQLSQDKQLDLQICVIEKAEIIGGHTLSGAVLDPKSLSELLPDWQQRQPPTHTAVTKDEFLLLTQQKAFQLPTPPQMQNHGNYIISLSQLTRWLAEQAEDLGVNIFPGFAATEFIEDNTRIIGIITGDKGVAKNGQHKENYQAGFALLAKQVIMAEGCRGSLTEELFAKYALRRDCDPQTYGLGIKEVWEIPADLHQAGKVTHSIGWPLDHATYGGSFMYHFDKNLLSIGFVVGLDYQNPYLNPYEEFQRFKNHARVRPLLKNSKRIAYGARTLIEGGVQSLPKLSFPGGLIIGDAAGFLNVPKIKGIHTAIQSGIIAANSIIEEIKNEKLIELKNYIKHIKNNWLWKELHQVRNIRPAMRWGLIPGIAYAALDTYVFHGKAPWTFHHKTSDRAATKLAKDCSKIEYPKHDNQVSFDLSRSVYLANLAYDENQPVHLKLNDSDIVPIKVNLEKYASPETRYCPAGVYEIVRTEAEKPYLQINNGNCIHCKACDIKDPRHNIVWTPSEGGSGPNYEIT